ncbi:MAG TPA: hypothetical protein VLJ86_27530, partial [Ramlibacter sp.]|nr:hypothetical protein [Ramlibacter sp.]
MSKSAHASIQAPDTAEIERARADETLRAVALAVSGAPGGNVFGELVGLLASILHVEVAFIAR